MSLINESHDPALKSWVEQANQPGSDFPIQNLPFGRYRSIGADEDFKIGVAIGDQILDLQGTGLIDSPDMNALMALDSTTRLTLRRDISRGLAQGSPQQQAWSKLLSAQDAVEMAVPCRIGDYTDFYTGIHHATSVGKLFRPDQPLMPNYKWVPIGYHGRSSSIRVSGQKFRRPQGQTKAPDAAQPSFGPSRRLDYELELGYFVGRGNELGQPVSIKDADDHLFGVTLLNDWSARDIQAWEYQPLGPFLSKNFASTISPWVVTTEALAPFRAPLKRPEGDPQPLPYLDGDFNRKSGIFDVMLEVLILTQRMAEAGLAPERLTLGDAGAAAYWTAAQLLTHHTVNGCNLQSGDLLGSGTLSGPAANEAGSLLELTEGGKRPVQLANGEQRTFLEDGDTLILRGWCERPGVVRIGFGEVRGTVLA
ncbi:MULTISPECIES: fumarylacetoacetase [Caballeronia]|uniref:fumarylacetoacetase n=1 Tax=Caballeronia zhejiangensis TaxID=871203 RepID=A0A656QDE1_9BURK|nr:MULTISPECIES: fumarylacetoacetase [Caballeronia]EKS71845.1 fumarylacetoacetase [Burkholderia sp. SJ98]KAK45389.1 fumarylacetoacetase [Caballeronia jiangsuensis]KDR25004.1 fumarylacetoacetase [Caballeronia zhejiangensis]MDR5748148.1 fumarylacetoacetase [Caballeronia sp. LZ029]